MKHIRSLILVLGFLFGSSFGVAQSPSDFTTYMFGSLGVIEVDCDPKVYEVFTSQLGFVLWCGETLDSFDLFRQKWDLYADWEGNAPFLPQPETPWSYQFSSYSRHY